jgi:hypothetical protein
LLVTGDGENCHRLPVRGYMLKRSLSGDILKRGWMSCPGGKNKSWIPQWIINRMPPHNVYIESCAGVGAVFRLKLPATIDNIAKGADAGVTPEMAMEASPLSDRDFLVLLQAGENFYPRIITEDHFALRGQLA